MLSEVEHLNLNGVTLGIQYGVALGILFVSPYYASGKIHVVVLLGEFCQGIHIVGKTTVGIFLDVGVVHVQLSHKHTVCSLGVLVGTVGLEVFLHCSAAVELICSGKVASLHFLEDCAGINESAFREVKVDTGTQELLGKHRDVEEVGVESGEVASRKFLVEFGSHLLEGRLAFNVGIRDTC